MVSSSVKWRTGDPEDSKLVTYHVDIFQVLTIDNNALSFYLLCTVKAGGKYDQGPKTKTQPYQPVQYPHSLLRPFYKLNEIL